MVRIVLLCVALASFGAIRSDAGQDTPPADIVGVYRCAGFNPDGSMYSAVVEIFKIDKTYRVLWVLPDDSFVVGVGIQTGNMLSVSYFGGSPAIVVYSRDGDSLHGEWTVGGFDGAVYTETLVRLPGHPSLNVPLPTRQESAPRPGRAI